MIVYGILSLFLSQHGILTRRQTATQVARLLPQEVLRKEAGGGGDQVALRSEDKENGALCGQLFM